MAALMTETVTLAALSAEHGLCQRKGFNPSCDLDEFAIVV
jgi:hypothetical protein